MTASTTEPVITKKTKRYPTFSGNFLKGRFNGQLRSVLKTWKENTARGSAKARDFRRAIDHRDVTVPPRITATQAKQLKDLGIPVPTGVEVLPPRVAVKSRARVLSPA